MRLLLLILLLCPLLNAWGLKAHEAQVRAAFKMLPPGFPAFFRQALPDLILLGSEPDRWRSNAFPAATESTGGNHVFAWELAPQPLPPHRHAYLLALAKAGHIDASTPSMRRIGFGVYAIEETAELLTGAFARWRSAPIGSTEKRRLEQTILFFAGTLAHWAGDMSQPMHCSIHLLGWSPRVPNPNQYTTDPTFHARFEVEYVDSILNLSAVAAAMPPPAPIVTWLNTAQNHTARCNSHIETLYVMERQTPFGRQFTEPSRHSFTTARIAEGAAMIRDLWIESWHRSK